MAKHILTSTITPMKSGGIRPVLSCSPQGSSFFPWRLPRTLLAGMLSLGAAAALHAQEPFAQDIVPTVSFSESYVEALKSATEDGYTEYYVEASNAQSKLNVTAKLSTSGIDLSSLNAETPIEISVGDFEISGVLGDDPSYKPGATSIQLPITDEDWDTGETIQVGRAIVSWNGKEININVTVRRPDTYSAAASYYIGGDEKIEDTTTCWFAFADRELSERTVYLKGNAQLSTKKIGTGANAEEFELATVQLSGEIDTVRPKVKLVGVKDGAIVSSSDFSFEVSASDNRSVVDVLAKVNDEEDYTSLSEGDEGKWSLDGIVLNPGSNIIRVIAIDEDGVESVVEKAEVRYWMPLVVNVSGQGTVTKGFAGSSLREPGAQLSLKAVPSNGYIFAGWSGSLESSSPTLSFQMQPGMTFTANFIPNPFTAVKGTYSGLLSPQDGSFGGGAVNVQLTGAGSFTAKVTLNGQSETLTGSFDTAGHFASTVTLGNGTPVSVDLQLGLGDDANAISGTISDGVNTFDLSSERNVFSAKNPAPQAGYYTVALPASDVPGTPQGDGFATLKVAANGGVTLTGSLADGTPFSYSSSMSQNGTFGVYFAPYTGKGSLYGVVTFREQQGVSDLDGTLRWVKAPATTQDGFYAGGFSVDTALVGSRYEAPRRNQRVIALANASGNAKVTIGEGGIANPIEKTTTINAASRLAVVSASTDKLNVNITSPTGLFSGSFVDPSTGAQRKFNGVFLQKSNVGAGVFRGANTAGYISITAP